MSQHPAEPITTAIIGLGRAGWDIHWRQLLKDNPRFAVTAVVEPMAERQDEARAEIGCRAYGSLAEFLADPCAELVVIATPSGGHGSESVTCLQHGLHVVVDKPMCQSVREADLMIAAARGNGRVLTCYHPLRFRADFLLMQEVLRSGRLGRIVEIKSHRSGFNRRNDWVMRRAVGGGLHNVWGSHSVDQCLQLAGAPAQDVFSDLQSTVTPGDADDHCKIVIRCTNGVLADVEVSNCQVFPSQPEWMIAGTCGGLIATPEGLQVKWFDPAEAPPIEVVDGPAQGRRYGNDDVLPWREELLPYPTVAGPSAFYTSVADAIRMGTPVAVTPESARDNIAVLETCRHQNPHLWSGLEG